MNKLTNYLVESIMNEEESIKRTIVVYSGRFQPMHKGHYGVYNHLVKKFGKDNVYIGTSDKVDPPRSPFNFKEKKKIMTTMFPIPKDKVIFIKNPYNPKEILTKFDEKTTAYVTVVSEKDSSRLGGKYFTKYEDNPTQGYKDKGYVYVSPMFGDSISASVVRDTLSKGDSPEAKKFFKSKLYSKFNDSIYNMIIGKLNESLVIEKETIEEWLLKEATRGHVGSADDGPLGFFPNFTVFDRISVKRAQKIGYDVVKMIMTGDIQNYQERPPYPNGPVTAVSFYPAGVIGKMTPNNQVDVYSSSAYSQWYKHITRKASLAGYELVQTQLEKTMQKKIKHMSGLDAQGDRDIASEFEKMMNESITLPVEIGDTLLMGKWKNKKVVVKTIGKDEHGMPTVNGKKVVSFRYGKKGPNIFDNVVELEELAKHGNYFKNLGVLRRDMPQIKSGDLRDYLKWLGEQGISHKGEKIPISKLELTQKDIDPKKVDSLQSAPEKVLSKPIIVSKDGFVLDGHHRIVALYNLKPNFKIPAVRVDTPMIQLLGLTKDYPKVSYKEVNETLTLTEATHKLKINIPANIKKLQKMFKKSGFKLYVVGGAIRDAILGKSPKDYDLATDAKPDEVLKIARDNNLHTAEVGKSFGVVIVDGDEIATFRKDIGKGRRPDSVDYTDIEGDVKRRDLTINALFYDLDREEIVDLVGGIADLKGKNIKTVGKAEERFDEDELRKLRAFRFHSRIGGKWDKDTELALKNNVSLNDVSGERIRDEFLKSIKSAKSVKTYFQTIEKFGYLKLILPNLKINKPFIEESDYKVLLAYLLKDNKKVSGTLNKLKYSHEESMDIQFLIDLIDFKSIDIRALKNKQEKQIHLTNPQIEKFGKLVGKDLKKFVNFKTKLKGKDIPKDLKKSDIRVWMDKEEEKRFLNESINEKMIDELAWEKSAFDLAFREYIPITDKMMKLLFGSQRINAFHTTDVDYLPDLIKIQNTKKTVSVFTKTRKNGRIVRGEGIKTDGGVLVYLSGNLLLESENDVMSAPDFQGRRWVSQDYLFGKKVKIEKPRELQKIYLKYFNSELTGKEKQRFITLYFDLIDSLLLKKKDDIIKNLTRKKLGANWNELLINNIKIKKILLYVIPEDKYFNMKPYDVYSQKMKKVEKRYKNITVTNYIKDMSKFISSNGGSLYENINESLESNLESKYGIALDLYDHDDYLILSKIVVPKDQRGTGIGSKSMEDIIDYADKNNKDIFLTPDTTFGGSKGRLVKFYKSFGFKPNKGRNRDFRTRESMIRLHEMARKDLKQVEKFADSKLSPEDVQFTNHFFDRVNDPRNGKEITPSELIGFFKRLSRHKKEFLDFVKKYKEFTITDKKTKINIPLVTQANKVIAKTVMRKNNWKSHDKVLTFEDQFRPDLAKKPKTWYKLDTKSVLKISDNVIDLVQTAYKKTPDGSFVNNKSDLNSSVFWNAIDVDGSEDADAVIFGRKSPNGIKIQGMGHDGDRKSIDAVLVRLSKVLKQKGYWVEASDALEHVFYKMGVPYISSEKVAQSIFPNSDLKMTGKKGQYTRKLQNGKVIQETIFGNPKTSVKEQISEGISVNQFKGGLLDLQKAVKTETKGMTGRISIEYYQNAMKMGVKEKIIDNKTRLKLNRWNKKNFGLGGMHTKDAIVQGIDIALNSLNENTHIDSIDELYSDIDKMLNRVEEGLFQSNTKMKPHDKIITGAVIEFMKSKLGFNGKITVRKKDNDSLIGDVTLNDNSLNKGKFTLHYNPNQSLTLQIQSMIHELTHVSQISKKQLTPSKDYKEILWKGKPALKVSDYKKLQKNFNEYKKLPWEAEAYSNMTKFYKPFLQSEYWKGLKGQNEIVDQYIDNLTENILQEGGKATGGSPIPAELTMTMYNSVIKDISKTFKLTSGDFKPLGSTGKKKKGDFSGDIDMAIDAGKIGANFNLKFNEVQDFIYKKIKSKFNNVVNSKGFGIISFLYPIPKSDEYGQVDLMLSDNLELTNFMFHSPDFTKNESKYKGLYRNIIFTNIIKYIDTGDVNKYFEDGKDKGEVAEFSKYSLTGKDGLMKQIKSYRGKNGKVKNPKTLKGSNQIITQVPIEIVKFVLGDDATIESVQSFETIYKIMNKSSFRYKKNNKKVIDSFKHAIEHLKLPLPSEI